MSIVKHFGEAGGGVADDSDTIQHAIDEGDGVLEFSKGTYRITRPIVLDLTRHGYMGIRGADGTARIVMAGPGPAYHVMGDHQGTAAPKTVKDHTWNDERFPIISGIEIVGAHPEAEGIRLERTMQCVITNVLVRRCRCGIHLVERNRNFILSGSHLYENRQVGIHFDRVNLHQVNIIGNHISYNARAGILITGGEVRNLQITGNDIEYNDDDPEGSADIWIDTTRGTMRELTISGNTIQAVPSPRGANVRIVGMPSETADKSGLIAIAGNLIGSQTVNIDLEHTRGLTITGNSIYSAAELSIHARKCRTIVVSSNSIDHNPGIEERMKDGIRFDDCAGCCVNGMVMEDCRYGDEAGGGAITMVHCRDMAVSSCQVLDPAVRGCYLENCRRCRISDNTILDRRDPQRMKAAVQLDAQCAHNLVRHNLLQAGTAGAILPESAADADANTILQNPAHLEGLP